MKTCEQCGKRTRVANNRSHSNIATKRRQGVNLQRTRIAGKRVLWCSSCIKAATKTK